MRVAPSIRRRSSDSVTFWRAELRVQSSRPDWPKTNPDWDDDQIYFGQTLKVCEIIDVLPNLATTLAAGLRPECVLVQGLT